MAKTLQTGDRGDDVKQLQATLNALGYGPLKEDGIFGAQTKAALVREEGLQGTHLTYATAVSAGSFTITLDTAASGSWPFRFIVFN